MSVLSKAKSAARKLVSPLLDAREYRSKAHLYGPVQSNLDKGRHLDEATAWLMRAQDHGDDRGVSYGAEFGGEFLASYPETTGYIICTFLDLARHYDDEQFLRRAIEMGEWEADIQLSCGAVMGGMYNKNPTPAVFNTGMVLLGWAALLRQTESQRFAEAGRRAGRWLLEVQEADGNWVRCNSEFAKPSSTVYNVKAAWGLAEMGAGLGEESFISAAIRNAEYALYKQLPNGWFSDCCLDDAERPLLHTLAYTMQGLVGIGKLANRRDFIDASQRTAQSLLSLMTQDGFIPGRIDRNFNAAVDWCCLTGTAQTAIVWSELDLLTDHGRDYREAAARATDYLMARHDTTNSDDRIRGGTAGSWPVWAPYGRYKVLNWATKFFVDALLNDLRVPR